MVVWYPVVADDDPSFQDFVQDLLEPAFEILGKKGAKRAGLIGGSAKFEARCNCHRH
jgi:hypothetical protein